MMMNNLPGHLQPFNIEFSNGNHAAACRVTPAHPANEPLEVLRIGTPQPVIFISGGAGGMSDKDRKDTQKMMLEVARFAQANNVVVVDGGTEAGVMDMIGEARKKSRCTFPLIGVSPLGKVNFPGHNNPASEAVLEDSHSHFILVDGDEWGAESKTIMKLVHTLCEGDAMPAVGILINGGGIALHEVYLASTTEHKIPMIVIEGSGRTADTISTAFRAGRTSQRIVQAILDGGDIQLVGSVEAPETIYDHLRQRFASKQSK